MLGCSSAGGFAFGGYRDDRVVAIAFPAAAFRAEAVWLRDLRQHMALDWIRTLRRLASGFGAVEPGWARFGLLMIDGLCRREEVVVATVDAALGDLPVVGGSAGDGLLFRRTHLALDGESHAESAIFCLVASAFPVEEVIFDHFTPTSDRMVVTEALPEERVILSINAEPAAEEYARLIGVRGGGARAARLRRPPAPGAAGGAACRRVDPGGHAGARPQPDVLGRGRHDDDARAGGEPDRGPRGADERARADGAHPRLRLRAAADRAGAGGARRGPSGGSTASTGWRASTPTASSTAGCT